MRPSVSRALLLTVCLVLGATSLANAAALTLAWDTATDGLTAGYVVVYGTASGVYTSRLDVGLVTTRRVEGLQSGVRYYFRVQAYSADGVLSDFSAEVSGVTPGGSGGGGGGSSSGGGGGGGSSSGGASSASGSATAGGGSAVAFMRDGRFIDISWAPIGGVSEYRVEVGNEPGHTAFSALTTDTAVTFDTSDMPSTSYHVRVRGMVGGVPGAASNEEVVAGSAFPRLDASTNAAGNCGNPPGAPRQFTAGANGAAVHLGWQPGSGSSAASYLLQVGSMPGLYNLMLVPFPGSQHSLDATAAFGSYALRLMATNDCGPSIWGAEAILNVGVSGASASASGPTPGAPQALTQMVSGTLVTLTWTGPASGAATRYLIEATIPDGTLVASLDTGNPSTTFSHPDTPAGHYIVTVRAGNAAGFGPPSSPVTVIVP
jgi:hypothetical protein